MISGSNHIPRVSNQEKEKIIMCFSLKPSKSNHICKRPILLKVSEIIFIDICDK